MPSRRLAGTGPVRAPPFHRSGRAAAPIPTQASRTGAGEGTQANRERGPCLTGSRRGMAEELAGTGKTRAGRKPYFLLYIQTNRIH